MRRAIAILALLAGGCHEPPAPHDHILFAHGPHLREGMSCARCHTVPASDGAVADEDSATPSATRPMLPSEESCRGCHDDPARDRCSRCHTVPASPGRYAARTDDIRFDHEDHDDPESGRCVSCHGEDMTSLATFEPGRPPMDTCTSSCHADDMRSLACARCHQDLHQYSLNDVALVDHGIGFLRRHGARARADAALCSQCHEPTFCEDCHLTAQGPPLEVYDPALVYRDFVHRGDFTARHGVEAGLERGTCARCHGVSFCDGCHTASGIGGSVAPGSPHPPGWLDPLSSVGHAREARRDLLGCVSCHESDAERTCVPCHRVGGVAGNPHPPGFGASMDPLLHGVCRACHAP
ncbi:MAG: hypothetical protein H6719_31485 [Sandaracinaceae bacterium]|nr:hypothetical protein [Sandaracinaceae bacterium]